MAKTKKPTGLSITRDVNKITLSWKIGDENYDAGQNLQFISKVNGRWKQWDNYEVTTRDTSKVITINLNQWYPIVNNYLTGVGFRVRGKRTGYDWSDFETFSINMYPSAVPTISSSLNGANQFKATFNIVAKDDDKQIFRAYEWQTILVENSEETDGSKLTWDSSQSGWDTGNGTTTSGTISITEDTSVTQTLSHTRWVRIRSKSPAGNSEWAYTKHVYALPYSANLLGVNTTDTNSGYLVTALWNATQNASRPIDEVRVQYAMAVPTPNLLPPANPSWTDAVTAKDTEGNDTVSFTIGHSLADDQCLFIRVVTEHDNRESYSNVVLAKKGRLSAPSNLSVNVSGNTATVTVTNNSNACVYTGSDATVNRLFLIISYGNPNPSFVNGVDIGMIPTGQSSATVTLPTSTQTNYIIQVQAVVGTFTRRLLGDGSTRYTVKAEMISDKVSTSGQVPVAPSNVNVTIQKNGKAEVNWEWSWQTADSAEISWSENENAWASTEEPTTFAIDHITESWSIDGLEAGKRYYVRIRLKDDDVFGPYSETVMFDVKYQPDTPVLVLSDSVISVSGKVTGSWNYISGDGTPQTYAEIMCNNVIIAHTTSSKHITLYAQDLGWTQGTYTMKLRVKSESGVFSDWSNEVSVIVSKPLTAQITSDTLEDITITVDGETRQAVALTQMPLSITVKGAGTGGVTSLIIERAEPYYVLRPDETEFNGYEGETIYQASHVGESAFNITTSDLLGSFDEGAKYRIIATVKDGLGQVSTVEKDFEVRWANHALVPNGSVVINGLTALIQVTSSGAREGDVCDIYRLTADKPEIVYPNAEFGETYIDPYPAVNGGYRIVYKTSNGDYITDDNTFAWLDLDSDFEYDKTIIDFGTDRVELYYNVDVNHSWKKDFTETKYLGGSIQGDWNPTVERSSSVSAVTLNPLEPDTIRGLRRLAVYTGLCHIRTKDGSSFPADIQVSESRSHDRYGLISEFTLNITRVDSQGYDGMLMEE